MIKHYWIHIQIFPRLRAGQDRRAYQITLRIPKCFLTFLNPLDPFHFPSNWKNGLHLSANYETKWFSVAINLVSFCTSLRVLGRASCSIALIWSGFTQMPRFVIIYPKKFPELTLNAHLLVLRHSLCCLKISKVSFKSITCLSSFLLLTTMSSL